MKTMVKAALGLGVAIAVAYATMPAARGWILASVPFLFFLLCPLMMFFMMKGMQSCDEGQRAGKAQTDKAASPPLVGHSPLGD
ncbi:DUF2933 domain-containing protein [Castellaniella ginsengisoli]